MDLKVLQSQFLGDILTPGSTEYETSRRIWSGMIDRRPAAIARCSGPADVRAAVRFAVDQEIYPAIRAGGHSVAGFAMVDDGPDRHEGAFMSIWNAARRRVRICADQFAPTERQSSDARCRAVVASPYNCVSRSSSSHVRSGHVPNHDRHPLKGSERRLLPGARAIGIKAKAPANSILALVKTNQRQKAKAIYSGRLI
jgi:hypothetical protein